jgi:hypothetical protein
MCLLINARRKMFNTAETHARVWQYARIVYSNSTTKNISTIAMMALKVITV